MSRWSIFQRGNGRWVAQRTNADGKKEYLYARDRAALEARVVERDTPPPPPLPQPVLTVKQWATEWLDSYVRPDVAPNTYTLYDSIIRNHITPVVGDLPLNELSQVGCKRILNTLQSNGHQRTAKHARSIMQLMLDAAVANHHISSNPVRGLAVPKVQRRELKVLDRPDATRLLDHVKDDRLGALYTLAVSCGLRNSELRGLQWRDITLRDGTLRVAAQLQRVDGKWQRVEPKTQAGIRTLNLPTRAYEALVHHYEDEIGKGRGKDSDYIFNKNGQPLSDRTLRWFWKQQTDQLGVEGVRLHDLRHTCASLLLGSAVPVKVVQAVMGHASSRVTLDTYGHVFDESYSAAAAAMDEVLR